MGNRLGKQATGPGFVYILQNPGLRKGLLKIGGTARTGRDRAYEFNHDSRTMTPGIFECIFECHTNDWQRAEALVHKALDLDRRGKQLQEFFITDLEKAKEVITRTCIEVDTSAPTAPVGPQRRELKKRDIKPLRRELKPLHAVGEEPVEEETLEEQMRHVNAEVLAKLESAKGASERKAATLDKQGRTMFDRMAEVRRALDAEIDAGYYFTVVFQTREQRDALLEAFRLPLLMHVNGVKFARALGVTLPAGVTWKDGGPAPKLAALALDVVKR